MLLSRDEMTNNIVNAEKEQSGQRVHVSDVPDEKSIAAQGYSHLLSRDRRRRQEDEIEKV